MTTTGTLVSRTAMMFCPIQLAADLKQGPTWPQYTEKNEVNKADV